MLSTEQIQFINDYLENSDVIHVDTRLEMVDHVASNIEERIENGDQRDFYFIFKDYMVEHKGRLLKNNRQFLRAAETKILKSIGKTMLSLSGVLLFIVAFASLYLLYSNFQSNELTPYVLFIPILGFMLFAVAYFLGLKLFKLNRYSSIERMGFVCGIFYQILYFISIFYDKITASQNILLLTLIVSFSIVLLFAIIKVTAAMVKSYRDKFEVVK